MKNATVTIDYESFQEIKEKADRLESVLKKIDQNEKERNGFMERLMSCIENANGRKAAEQKQYYIAMGIRAICEHYEMDAATEYGELDEGQAPEGG